MSGAGTGTPVTTGSVLFSVAEARAFDKEQLASDTDYPSATITAKETEIHAFLHRACGVWFCPVTTTDEYHDGDGSRTLMLAEALVTSVTAASYRDAGTSTWTALTAAELALIQVSDAGMVYRDGSYFTSGVRNWKFTYVSGYTTVPERIKRAALRICVQELPATNVPFTAESYDAGGMSIDFARGDGYNGQWSRDAEVMNAIRMYDRSLPGIA